MYSQFCTKTLGEFTENQTIKVYHKMFGICRWIDMKNKTEMQLYHAIFKIGTLVTMLVTN